MSTYAIGDVHGCFEVLTRLLKQIHFDPAVDQLWFVGDLINRGPQSLETIRFVQTLGPSAQIVLGNHEITFLAIASGGVAYNPKYHQFGALLEAPDKVQIVRWLRDQPLFYRDQSLGYCMVHAGILPLWDVVQTQALATEVAAVLQSDQWIALLDHLYAQDPDRWDPQAQGIVRWRFILNTLTRLRYCTATGLLALSDKGAGNTFTTEFRPWFEQQNPRTLEHKILFGHWSLLEGRCKAPNVFALDTGCVWGGHLSALRLEDAKWFSEAHSQPKGNLIA